MKIVINRCYGGFSISKEALLDLIKRGAACVEKISYQDYWGTDDGICLVEHLGKLEDFEEGFRACWCDNLYKDGFVYSLYSTFENQDIRKDPDLVSLVEENGSEFVSGRCAELAVVEIPDDVDWEIGEYDGVEWIAEKHRTWS